MVSSGDCLFHRSTNWIVNASRWICCTCELYCDSWLPVLVTVFQNCQSSILHRPARSAPLYSSTKPMSVVEDRLSGFLFWPSFCEGIPIPQWRDHSPLIAPYLRQGPLFGLAFPLLRTEYMDVFSRISLLPFGLSGGRGLRPLSSCCKSGIGDIRLW